MVGRRVPHRTFDYRPVVWYRDLKQLPGQTPTMPEKREIGRLLRDFLQTLATLAQPQQGNICRAPSLRTPFRAALIVATRATAGGCAGSHKVVNAIARFVHPRLASSTRTLLNADVAVVPTKRQRATD